MRNIDLPRPVVALVIALGVLAAATALAAGLAEHVFVARLERDAKADFAERFGAANPRRGRPDTGTSNDPLMSFELGAANDTLAAAEFDSLVRAAVTDAQATLTSIRAEPAPDGGESERQLVVHAIFEARIEALQQILVRLEAGPPLVIVKSLDVQPVQGDGDPAAPLLRASVEASAWWRVQK